MNENGVDGYAINIPATMKRATNATTDANHYLHV